MSQEHQVSVSRKYMSSTRSVKDQYEAS